MSRQNPIFIQGLLVLGGLLLAIKLISAVPSGGIGKALLVLFIGACALVLVPIIYRHVRAAEQSRAAGRTNAALLHKAGECIERHIEVLVRKRSQLVVRNEYGTLQTVAWEKEKVTFIRDQIVPTLSQSEFDCLEGSRATIEVMIDDRVAEMITSAAIVVPGFSENFSGTEFEAFCAAELNRAGWDARATQKSRDQGVDVVATKGGIRLVLQCKMHSRPIGNKAIQEIAAGRANEMADIAAVVSNQSYTIAARRLAATNNVYLLHFADLAKARSQWPKANA